MIEIYCDESRPEVIFGNKNKLNQYNKYMLIGGIWIRKEDREIIKRKIKKLQQRHNTYGEIKWKSVSPSKLSFYLELVNLFFENEIRFRCIIIDGNEFDSKQYHESDDELGFYKFYYQLIFHWLAPFESHSIYLDYKKNKLHDRLQTLEKVLSVSSLSLINRVQAVPSKESLLIQLSDFLVGAINYKFHGLKTSESKLAIIKSIENNLGHAIRKTYKNEHKFNIFQMRLS